MTAFLAKLQRLAKDWFTAANGEDYAIGKLGATIMFLVGLPYPYVVLLTRDAMPSLLEAGGFYTGLSAGCAGLIWGTNATERPAGGGGA